MVGVGQAWWDLLWKGKGRRTRGQGTGDRGYFPLYEWSLLPCLSPSRLPWPCCPPPWRVPSSPTLPALYRWCTFPSALSPPWRVFSFPFLSPHSQASEVCALWSAVFSWYSLYLKHISPSSPKLAIFNWYATPIFKTCNTWLFRQGHWTFFH